MRTPRRLLALVICGGMTPAGAVAKEFPVARGQKTVWAYFDGHDPVANDWYSPQFEAVGWKQGGAPLGYGDEGLTTTLSFGGDKNAKPITNYFRHTFTLGDAQLKDLEAAEILLRRDDGAVVYLDGTEVARCRNMPTGQIGRKTLPLSALSGAAETEFVRLRVDSERLGAGKHVLAVEVHQSSPQSSDVVFDLELILYSKGEAPKRNFYTEAMMAVQEGRQAEAAALFARVEPESIESAEMRARIGYTLLAERLGKMQLALRFVRSGYAELPEDIEVVRAYVRTHVLAREGLLVSVKPRKPVEKPDPELAFIAAAPPYPVEGKTFPRAELEADLDYLELMLANCYSYLERRGADYRQALDIMRGTLEDKTPLEAFSFRLARLFTIFGDGHSSVHAWPGGPPDRLHVAFAVHDGRIVVTQPNRGGLLDAEHPYVAAIDGVDIEAWRREAAFYVEDGAPHWEMRGVLQRLPRIGLLRAHLGLQNADSATLRLAAADPSKTTEIKLDLNRRRPGRIRKRRAENTREIDGIGYLRIRRMASTEGQLRGLRNAMDKFRDTRGLIIDVRANGGGSQDTLRTMLPYFMPPEAPMKIVNVAAYRMPIRLPKPNPSGFLGLHNRGLHPAASKVWTAAERAQIETFLRTFKPDWELPSGKFTDWHVMAVKRSDNPKAYHYDKPVVVLGNAGSFSATDNFLGSFKGHPKVILMGGTSGGGSGRMQDYILPNSGLRFILCQMASYSANGRLIEGQGVVPDIEIQPSLADIAGDGDSVLDAALKHLRGE